MHENNVVVPVVENDLVDRIVLRLSSILDQIVLAQVGLPKEDFDVVESFKSVQFCPIK